MHFWVIREVIKAFKFEHAGHTVAETLLHGS